MPKTLNTAQLNELFQLYATSELTHSKRNTAAYANDVYEVTDTGGRVYIMRILRARLPSTAATEAAMQKRLAAAGIGTAVYLQFGDGKYVGEQAGTMFTLSRLIDGQVPASASLGLVKDFGAMLAKLHTCLEGMVIPPSGMQWFDRQNAAHNLGKYSGPLKDSLSRLYGTSQQLFSLNLPKAVIHADLWLGNVFAREDSITAVFDLETAESTLRILDIARTYVSMRRETRYAAQSLSDKLFEGYNAYAAVPLEPEEQINFRLATAYVAGVCATWHALHGTQYAGTYIKLGQEALGESA